MGVHDDVDDEVDAGEDPIIAEGNTEVRRRRRPRQGKAGFADAAEDDADAATNSAVVATIDASSTSTETEEEGVAPPPPMPPVDRDWLRKLLRRHARPSARAESSPEGYNGSGEGEGDDHGDAGGEDAEDEKKTEGGDDSDPCRTSPPCLSGDDDVDCEKRTDDNPYPPPIDPTIHALAVAPMVDQSDLPFRLLCRKYGANLAYTPMAHARLFVTSPQYRSRFWDCIHGTPPEDRPLIIQFCGGDPDVMLEAAKFVENHCDAVDVNCGCPQFIARRGNYGAFLLEQEELLVNVVRTMAAGLSCPVTVKVRLLPTGVEDSISLYSRLIDAGAAMLTIHGRTRHQVGIKTGCADWEAVRQVVDALGHRVPILANGSVSSLDEVAECLRCTGADGVMSSEAILEYPALFSPHSICPTTGGRTSPSRVHLAREYMELADVHPPGECGQGSPIKCPRMHLHKMLHADLQQSPQLRDLAIGAKTIPEIWGIVDAVEEFQRESGHDVGGEELSWYLRHRKVDERTGVNVSGAKYAKTKIVRQIELDDDVAEDMGNMFGEDW